MSNKPSFFRKIVILVFILLVPVIVLYSYSYHISVNVVKSEIENTAMRQMNFFLSQIENNAAQLAMHSVILSNESGIRGLIRLHERSSYVDILLTKKQIEEKLALYSTSSTWKNEISVYSPVSDTVLTTSSASDYRMPDVRAEWIGRWTYSDGGGVPGGGRFTWYTADPPTAGSNPSAASLIVEVSFPADNLVAMLDQFMTSRQGNPFFFAPGQAPIMNRSGDRDSIMALTELLNADPPAGQPLQQQMTIADERYLVSCVPSGNLGWYLVDFVPLGEVLQPIDTNRNFFYTVILILLVLGIGVSSVIYRNVQVPIRELLHNVQKLKRGNYSARLVHQPRSEFHFLFTRFNEMAEQIQQLIEKVYAEKLRSREATVKQLQSQINPHFFYNCLFFIVGMSRLGRNEAVEAMATNLGDYYRYTTRVENQTATLGDELGLVRNYLAIQELRKQIEYDIEVPDEMLDAPLPRLILQPLVENAIVHGIEPLTSPGRIVIRGERSGDGYRIAVEDNGVGMDETALDELRRKCIEPLTEEMGCGLWNVHQRLSYIYGDEAGLSLDRSALGGLKATLAWGKDDAHHV